MIPRGGRQTVLLKKGTLYSSHWFVQAPYLISNQAFSMLAQSKPYTIPLEWPQMIIEPIT